LGLDLHREGVVRFPVSKGQEEKSRKKKPWKKNVVGDQKGGGSGSGRGKVPTYCRRQRRISTLTASVWEIDYWGRKHYCVGKRREGGTLAGQLYLFTSLGGGRALGARKSQGVSSGRTPEDAASKKTGKGKED